MQRDERYNLVTSNKIHTEASELAIPMPDKPAAGHCGDLLIQATFPSNVIGTNYITGGYQEEDAKIMQLNHDLMCGKLTI